MRSKSNRSTGNNIEKLKEFVLKHLFTSDLKEDDLFFFNLNFNEHGELILGEGTNQAHLNLIMASKYSLSMLSKGGTGHTDAVKEVVKESDLSWS